MAVIINITIVAEKEPKKDVLMYVYEYLDGVFPKNKGINHTVHDYTDYDKILDWIRKLAE